MKNYLVVFFVFGCTSALAQLQLHKDFTPVTPPVVGSDEWHHLNYAQQEFNVLLDGDQLVITETKETSQTELNVVGGKLIGIDHGEWGGSLSFLPDGKGAVGRKIAEGNILRIFLWRDNIYFIDALAHLDYNAGALYRLDRSDTTFSPVKIMDFDNAPNALAITQDTLFVAAHSCFFVVTSAGQQKYFPDAFWSSLYPNSVAVKNSGEIYLGVRGGITQINLNEGRVLLYRYNRIRSSWRQKPVRVKSVTIEPVK